MDYITNGHKHPSVTRMTTISGLSADDLAYYHLQIKIYRKKIDKIVKCYSERKLELNLRKFLIA